MSKRPVNTRHRKHVRQQTWIHPLSTIGDDILIEDIRSAIQDFQNEKDIQTDITSYVYAKLMVGGDTKVQHRINNLMREIEKQDVMSLSYRDDRIKTEV